MSESQEIRMLSETELIIEKFAIKDRLKAAMGRDDISKADKRIGQLLLNKLMRAKRFVNLIAQARRGNAKAWYQILKYLSSKRQYRVALGVIIPLLIKIVRID
jgi:hypothetical protein